MWISYRKYTTFTGVGIINSLLTQQFALCRESLHAYLKLLLLTSKGVPHRIILMGIYKLQNTVQKYDWGSPEWIPALLNQDNPSNEPMAELWMGAHPKAPSTVMRPGAERNLEEIIGEQPETVLGKKINEKFKGKLPFLFKVLAAENPLSIQAHPNKQQAEEGFLRENGFGIPLDDFYRNYKDDNHKPEIICAMTDYIAMRGFRPLEQIRTEFMVIFSDISHPFYVPRADVTGDEEQEELKCFFESILSVDEDERIQLIDHALNYIKNKELHYIWMRKLNEKYPGDVGVLCPLFLNVLKLEPGEAMYLPAGELHAYLHGLGIELMANSDNVLRGGCTKKNIAKDELLKVLRFESVIPEIYHPAPDLNGEIIYPSPAEEFRLSAIELRNDKEYSNSHITSAEILLCTEGGGTLSSGKDEQVILKKGESAVIYADTGSYTLSGEGKIFKAAVQ